MSDLSGHHRWLASSAAAFLAGREREAEPPTAGRDELHIHELRFLRLISAAEIARVVPLRQTIPLPKTAQSDPNFREIEKKGTRSEWSGRLNTAAG